MTPQDLLEAALRSAEPNEAGLRHLEAREATAAKDLAGARNALAECEVLEAELVQQHAKVNEKLVTLNREVRNLRTKNARIILDALRKPGAKAPEVSALLANCATAARSQGDQVAILREVLQHVVAEAKPLADIRKTEAEITVAQASRAWVLAAAFEDLLTLQIKMGAALEHDKSLSVNLGPGSHAHTYAAKLNEFDLEIGELQERLRREQATAQRYLEAL